MSIDYYNSESTSPYLCDVIVEYIRDVLREKQVVNFRDDVSWQFYTQWMDAINPGCERIGRYEFMSWFQTMEEWNKDYMDRGNMREYRRNCLDKAIKLTSNMELIFSLDVNNEG